MLEVAQKQSLIGIEELSSEEMVALFDLAAEFKKEPPPPLLKGKLMVSCFFEPSTRTRLSFEAAALKLGVHVIGFHEAESTSSTKGESLYDSMRTIGGYADLIVIRHPREGAARLALEASGKPVINAADGMNQHPTQALIDLFTMRETHGSLHGLHLGLLGDILHSRTGRTLAMAAALFQMRIYCISPEGLSFPKDVVDFLRRHACRFSFHTDPAEVLHKLDVCYVTRLQRERIKPGMTSPFILTPALVERMKPTMRILHALPRTDELPTSLDALPQAHYFEQAHNGICVRQALLTTLLGEHE